MQFLQGVSDCFLYGITAVHQQQKLKPKFSIIKITDDNLNQVLAQIIALLFSSTVWFVIEIGLATDEILNLKIYPSCPIVVLCYYLMLQVLRVTEYPASINCIIKKDDKKISTYIKNNPIIASIHEKICKFSKYRNPQVEEVYFQSRKIQILNYTDHSIKFSHYSSESFIDISNIYINICKKDAIFAFYEIQRENNLLCCECHKKSKKEIRYYKEKKFEFKSDWSSTLNQAKSLNEQIDKMILTKNFINENFNAFNACLLKDPLNDIFKIHNLLP